MTRTALTSILLFSLVSVVSAQDEGKKKTIAYVQKLQTSTGGFVSMMGPNIRVQPTLRATSSAVRALHYLGGEIPDKAACIKFVESCHHAESGGFADTPNGKPDVFTTAVGIMAVTELGMSTDKYGKGAVGNLDRHAATFDEIRIAVAGLERIKTIASNKEGWLRETAKGMKRNGTFGDGAGVARETASRVVTLLRLGEKATLPDIVIKTLDEGQRKDGGWGKAEDAAVSDLETTYRVMRCYMMLKAHPRNADAVHAFVAKCRNDDGGYGLVPGQPSSVNSTYFAAIVTHWLKK